MNAWLGLADLQNNSEQWTSGAKIKRRSASYPLEASYLGFFVISFDNIYITFFWKTFYAF